MFLSIWKSTPWWQQPSISAFPSFYDARYPSLMWDTIKEWLNGVFCLGHKATRLHAQAILTNPYETHHKPLRGLLLDPCKLDNQASVLSLNHSKLPLACKLASWAIASSACSAWKPLTASCLQASSCCSCCSCCSCSSCCQPGWCIQVVTSEAWTCITLQRRLMLITFVHLVES